MMGKQSRQIQMVILDIDSMIPEDHLLRRIKNCVNFDFIYEKAAPYYSHVGRKSIDPVVLIKMLLIGYLYGIRSERRLEEEVSLNLAYRWFCGIDLMHRVPDHSTFSQNRRRRFQETGIFREIFNEIVLKCTELGIVSGEIGVADGSFLPSNVSWDSRYEAVETVQRSTVKYMEELEVELSSMPGYKEPENVKKEKESLKSRTDPECGYIHQARKKGLGYLTEMTVDTSHGIITGVDCYPAHPDAVWCSDITYIWIFEGFVYLTSVMDLYSRKIISWVLSETLEASHVVECVEKAKRVRNVEKPLIFHCDRGCQYVSEAFQKATKGMIHSYSKKAYPWDNACIESFHALLKREWINRFKIFNYAHKLIFEYIETFYNTVRIHSHCGYLSPNEYEEQYLENIEENAIKIAS